MCVNDSILVKLRDSRLTWPIQRIVEKLGISIVAKSSHLDFQLKYFVNKFQLEYCIDVGAHHGEFVHRLHRLNCELETICFEPSSDACKILQSKFSGQIKIESFAITPEKGTFELFETGSVLASLKRRDGVDEIIKSEKVHGITLEEATLKLQKELWVKTLLKVDVQGGELEVLRSGEEFLKQCPVVITEAPLRDFYHNSYNIEELISYMGQLNFVIGAIHTPRFLGGNPIDCDIIFVRI